MLLVSSISLFGQEFKFVDFNQVEVHGEIQVVFEQAEQPGFTVQDAGMLEDLLIQEGELSLKINLSPMGKSRNQPRMVTVFYSKLKAVNLHDGAVAKVVGTLVSDYIEINLAKSSRMELEARIEKEVLASVSEKSSLKIQGTAQKLILKVQNMGRANCSNFQTEEVAVLAQMNGKAEVYAKDRIDATTASGGSVVYGGDPKKVEASQSSGGLEIRKI